MEFNKENEIHIVGLKIRTTNQELRAAKDIPALWNRFIREGISTQIINKQDTDIYCIYTEYEGDHNLPYTTLLGHRVPDLNNIPEGLVGMTFQKETYELFIAKGDLQKGVIVNKWMEIWNSNLNRTYQADFEIYGSKALDPKKAEVDIYVGVNT